jgi:uncharacterized membrane protein YecN with MAPEG domain
MKIKNESLAIKQRGVIKGILTAISLIAITFVLTIFFFPSTSPDSFPETLIFSLKWDLLIALSLTINIAMLAKHRFFSEQDIDGGGQANNSEEAKILQSTLQNTLEQSTLAFLIHTIWSATLPQCINIIPAATILFIIGRILFWKGYRHGAQSRALGFALTFYPSALMTLCLIFQMILKIFS